MREVWDGDRGMMDEEKGEKKSRKPKKRKKTWQRQKEQEGCPPVYWPKDILKRFNNREITLEQGHQLCEDMRV